MRIWLLVLLGLFVVAAGLCWAASIPGKPESPVAPPDRELPLAVDTAAPGRRIVSLDAPELAQSTESPAPSGPASEGSETEQLLHFSGRAVYADGSAIKQGRIGVAHLYAGTDSARRHPPVGADIKSDGSFHLHVPLRYTDGRYGLVYIVDEVQVVYREVVPIDTGVVLYAAEKARRVPGWVVLKDSPIAGSPPAVVQAVTVNDREEIWGRVAERTGERLDFDVATLSIDSPTDEEIVVGVHEVSRVEGVVTTAEKRFASVAEFARAAEGGIVMTCPQNQVIVPDFAGQPIDRVHFADAARQRESMRLVGEAGVIRSVLPGTYSVKGLVDGVQICTGLVLVPGRETSSVEWHASLPGAATLEVVVVADGSPVEGAVVSVALMDEDLRPWCVASAGETTDGDGLVRIPGLPFGDGKLFVRRNLVSQKPLAFELTVDRVSQSVTVGISGERYCDLDIVMPGVLWEVRPPLDVFVHPDMGSAWTMVASGLHAQSVRIPTEYGGVVAVRCGADWAGFGLVVAGVEPARVSVPLRLLEPLVVRTNRSGLELAVRALSNEPQLPWAVTRTAPMRWEVMRFAGQPIDLIVRESESEGRLLLRHRVGAGVTDEISLHVE